MVKEKFRFAKEHGIELNLKHPRTVKTELRKCKVERLEEKVRNQRWQGSLVTNSSHRIRNSALMRQEHVTNPLRTSAWESTFYGSLNGVF